ncbi:hypothetical protein Pla52n_08770 [Stieleria varia]|uniref:Glycosyltransferase RgtA/B/C/D-like domain-containing protein n=2 Tax=Stieleria varia TaxID=2528005 RepID=A0A5C6B7Q7_9BACT|nr:hypothetical protein Pla52n_08770 [Stieleria varia]
MLFRDLRPLLVMQTLLAVATVVLTWVFWNGVTDGIAGDLRVQAVWAIFLVPGWLVSARWTGRRCSFLSRYFAAAVSSLGIHSTLGVIASSLGWRLATYQIVFLLFLLFVIIDRARRLRKDSGRMPVTQSWSLPTMGIIAGIIVFSVSVYRVSRSNDIGQFVLQQQDMVAEDSLSVSAIGMKGMGVDEAMPRWNAHLWHMLPCLMADAAGVPVDQTLRIYAPIPLAATALLVFWYVVSQLSRTRRAPWITMLAMFGPVLLWYRNYTAFNYSFRLTNTFLLDKDVCLFVLIPAVALLAYRWIRGSRHSLWPLLFLAPAIVKFHPMTAVYLVMLCPWVALLSAKATFGCLRRVAAISVASVLLFVVVLLLGDAQSHHDQIREIVDIDFVDHQSGRPLHYWTGLYAGLQDNGLELDTTQWVGETFSLKASVISGDALLLTLHGAWLLLTFRLISKNRSSNAIRQWLAASYTIAALWLLWFASRFVLTAAPHLSGGVERLHWFAFLPGLVAVSCSLSWIVNGWLAEHHRPFVHRFAMSAVLVLILVSCVFYSMRRRSPLTGLRGVNSLLDFDLPYLKQRAEDASTKSLDDTLAKTRPEYLKHDDVVLYVDAKENESYWWIKQGIFWSDSYAEAFALHHRGDAFLRDREHFYAILDRVALQESSKQSIDLSEWLAEKQVTLLVDFRGGADDYFESLLTATSIPGQRLREGVWRIGERPN